LHRLKYKLRATIADQTGNPKPMYPMISKKMIVVSRQPENTHVNIQVALEGKVKAMFFVKQGSTRANITFSKDSFHIGEQALATCDIDNTKSEKDLRCVKFKFRRNIYATSKCGHKFHRDETILKREFPGI
jgi:hypothetical protein